MYSAFNTIFNTYIGGPMQNPNLDSFETRAIHLLPPLRLLVWRFIFEKTSDREPRNTNSELLFQIAQIYLIESQLGTLTSSTDLVVTQYAFVLALIEFNPMVSLGCHELRVFLRVPSSQLYSNP